MSYTQYVKENYSNARKSLVDSGRDSMPKNVIIELAIRWRQMKAPSTGAKTGRVRKSPERKSLGKTKTVSITLVFRQTNPDIRRKPSKEQLHEFLLTRGGFREVKAMLSGAYGVYAVDGKHEITAEIQKNMSNFNYEKNCVVTFTVPSKYSDKSIKEIVKMYGSSLSDGWHDVRPGTGLVYGENNIEHGVVDFSSLKISKA